MRQGLFAYFSGKGYKRILMPDFVPEGIYDPFLRLGYEIRFYHVSMDLGIDKNELFSIGEAFSPDIFVSIHYFGVYRPGILAAAREAMPRQVIFIEDFGHTLPTASVPLTGDICCYSFTKTLGVAEGSCVWFNARNYLEECRYEPDNGKSRELKKRMAAKLTAETICGRFCCNRYAASAIRMLFGNRAAYYPYLMSHYTSSLARVSPRWRSILDRVDFEAVTRRRRDIARLYCEKIDPDLLLHIPKEDMTRQALFGFPLRVKERNAFDEYLASHDIQGLILNDRWWFWRDTEPSELFYHHYLLPMNHYFSDKKIERVIRIVNDYGKNDQ